MIVLFALLVIVAGFGLVAAWLGENPGSVTMLWFGYQIETSVAVLILLALLAAIALTLSYNFLNRLLMAPGRFAERRSLKQYKVALAEITHSVAALASADMEGAKLHTRRAEKMLGTTPLTLLLRAQISKNAGSDEESRKLLEQLLAHPETEYLAAKSLSDAAEKQQLLPQALALAERANKINPAQAETALSVFELLLANGQFQEAEIHAVKARKAGAFNRADVARAHGRIALKQAENSYANGHRDNALLFATRAVKLCGGDIKSAEFLAKLYVETHQMKKAQKLIQTQWKAAPSSALAQYFLDAVADEKPAKQEKLVDALEASNPTASENSLLILI